MQRHIDIANLKQDPRSAAPRRGRPPLPTAGAARKHRGGPPDLSVDRVLAWADAFFERAGVWPDWQSGPIDEAPGENWFTVATALALGRRGLPRGGSLYDFLEEHRGTINRAEPNFSASQILAWAVDWQTRTGRRPRRNSGEIPNSGGVSWSIVDDAFKRWRGILPGRSSLARFLRSNRAVLRGPAVTEKQILFWADAYYNRTGTWPCARSGAIPEAPGENWRLLDRALAEGTRSLPGGSSLRELLIMERGPEARRYSSRRTPLAVPEILAWAESHHKRTGRWPSDRSGRIPETASETWRGVHCAMRRGGRGLPGGSSLARLLKEHRRALSNQCASSDEVPGAPGPNSSG
jgi:hypothetical protein